VSALGDLRPPRRRPRSPGQRPHSRPRCRTPPTYGQRRSQTPRPLPRRPWWSTRRPCRPTRGPPVATRLVAPA